MAPLKTLLATRTISQQERHSGLETTRPVAVEQTSEAQVHGEQSDFAGTVIGETQILRIAHHR